MALNQKERDWLQWLHQAKRKQIRLLERVGMGNRHRQNQLARFMGCG